MSRLFRENATIFDIGANLGHFSKEFCELYNKSCKVFSFEPVKYNYSILEKVVSEYSNVKVENFALSNVDGEDFIYIPVKKSKKIGNGLAHLGVEKDRDFIKEKIILKRMDDYVENNNINSLEFIKCDVEGAELLVFKGGIEAIKKFRPNIFCEIDEKMTQRLGYQPEDLWNFFDKINYKFYLYQDKETKFQQAIQYEMAADYFIIPAEINVEKII